MLDVTERKVFAVTTFVSACICLAPGEWVSGGALLVAAAVLWVRYLRDPRRNAKPPAKPDAPPENPVDDGGSPGKPGSAPVPPAPTS